MAREARCQIFVAAHANIKLLKQSKNSMIKRYLFCRIKMPFDKKTLTVPLQLVQKSFSPVELKPSPSCKEYPRTSLIEMEHRDCQARL